MLIDEVDTFFSENYYAKDDFTSSEINEDMAEGDEENKIKNKDENNSKARGIKLYYNRVSAHFIFKRFLFITQRLTMKKSIYLGQYITYTYTCIVK